jgi:predicted ATP-dependent endonuclease of OLD family
MLLHRLNKVEVQGFRSFGNARQTPSLPDTIAVFWGGNSQGKTSLAEAIEFLFSGQIARRELLASAKDEFTEAIRNVHIQPGDAVSVSAHIMCPDGTVKQHYLMTTNAASPAAAASMAKRQREYEMWLQGAEARKQEVKAKQEALLKQELAEADKQYRAAAQERYDESRRDAA